MATISESATGSTDGNGFSAYVSVSGTLSDSNGSGTLAVRVTLYSTNNNFSDWTIACTAIETESSPNYTVISNSVKRTLAKNSSLLVGQGSFPVSSYTGSRSLRFVVTVDGSGTASYIPDNTYVELSFNLPTIAPPFSFTPFSFTPFGFTPFSFTPFGFTPFGFTPFSFTPTPVPPSQPTNLIVTNLTQTSARLNWSAVSGATQYTVYLNGSQVGTVTNTANRYYDFTNLLPSTPYTLGVSVTTSSGTSTIATINTTTLNAPGMRYSQGISDFTELSKFKRYDSSQSRWVDLTKYKIYVSSTNTWKDISN